MYHILLCIGYWSILYFYLFICRGCNQEGLRAIKDRIDLFLLLWQKSELFLAEICLKKEKKM